MALDLKKKIGPLPVWGWTAVGAGALGIVYYLHERNAASTTASSTTASDQAAQLAAEQAANGDSGGYGPGYGYDSGGTGGVTPTTPPPADTSTVSDIDTQLQGINSELAQLSAQGVTDQTAGSTTIPFSTELSDVTGAIASLKAAGLVSSSAPNSASPAAKGKSVAGLPILKQLEDVKSALASGKAVPKLGANASKQLAAVGGNVQAAITAREDALTKAAKKPTTHATKPKK